MITDFGMSDKYRNVTLGKGVLGNRGGDPSLVREFSEQTQNYIDEEIARIMKERYDFVLKLLGKHKSLIDYIANRLMEVETIEGKEFYDIVNGESHCLELEEKAVEKKEVTSKKTVSRKAPNKKKE